MQLSSLWRDLYENYDSIFGQYMIPQLLTAVIPH